MRKIAIAAGLAVAVVALTAAPALAHVSVSPSSAAQGGFVTLTFQVPNETDDASTTKLEVQFPQDHPIADASVKAIPGWTVDVAKGDLAPPVTTDDGETLSEAVKTITWTASAGNGIEPGFFQQFLVSVGLPSDGDSLAFPALQTYSDGEVVRWIGIETEGGPESEYPAPTLALTPATGDAHGHNETTPTTVAEADHEASGSAASATESQVDTARNIAIIGVLLGIAGLVVAGIALSRKKPTAKA